MRIVRVLTGLVVIGWFGWDQVPPRPMPTDQRDQEAQPASSVSLVSARDHDPLVPPIPWPQRPAADRFEHDPAARFHPHGPQICASGCATSRHPTPRLSRRRFRDLLTQYSGQPVSSPSAALDELLFYAAQSRRYLADLDEGGLDAAHRDFLARELRFTHARIAIQVIDQRGNRRTWLSPTKVPLDRRHVFQMQTNELQPLVTSGTVKRVGLDRLWTRL